MLKMDTNWETVIKKEYENVKFHKEKQITEIWNNNRVFVKNENNAKKPHCVYWKVDDEHNQLLCKGKKIRVTSYDAEYEKTGTEVHSFVLPIATPPPLMTMWIPIPRNFVSKDSKELESLPFLGDDVIDDTFIEDLLGTYDGNWSGTKTKTIDDDLFVNLVQELIPYQNTMNLVLQSTSSQLTERCDYVNQIPTEESFPHPIIFEMISSYFDGIYSSDKYLKLTRQNKQCTLNVDEPAQMKKPLQRDQSLHSYRKLLCRRCFIYNCQLHLDQNDIQTSVKKRTFDVLKPFTEPCSNTCYLIMNDKTKGIEHLSAASESQNTTSKAMESDSTTDETANSKSEWNFSDQSMLLALLKVFPENCCAIAKAMLKSCDQVCQKIRSTEITDPEQVTNKKRGKKEQRVKNNGDKLIHLAKTYTPCDHDGSCHKNLDCLCLNCEKFCGCETDCRKRTRKCSCKGSCVICKCPCYDSQHECDPETCDCVSCKNVGIQRNEKKKLQIIASQIHGWGVAVKEPCQKNEFISEYRGEVISLKECERRGKVYDKEKCTYLFTLNDESVVDGTRFGSKIRFSNFSKTPNCYSRVMMVNGDHRIGFYALRYIEAGEELTIDYLTHDPTVLKEN